MCTDALMEWKGGRVWVSLCRRTAERGSCRRNRERGASEMGIQRLLLVEKLSWLAQSCQTMLKHLNRVAFVSVGALSRPAAASPAAVICISARTVGLRMPWH